MHTYYSDGLASPTEVVALAAARDVRFLAIADHDSARGYREAALLAGDAGIALIPAIEFTCRWDACSMPPGETDIDILGYYIDVESPVFREEEERGLRDFESRVQIWCSLLSVDGCPLTLADVYNQNPRYAGTKMLINAASEKKGDSWKGDRLVRKHIRSIPPARRTVEDAIAVIHAAGGAAVLAHPSTRYVRWEGNQRLDEVGLRLLVDSGLDGIEVYHPKLSPGERSHFLKLAMEFQLVITGGSDSHEAAGEDSRLGTEGVTAHTAKELARRALRHSVDRRAGLARNSAESAS